MEYWTRQVEYRHPIPNAVLAYSHESLKNGYLKILAVLLRRRGTVSVAQLTMFQRIVSGAKVAKTADDYLRAAQDIKVGAFTVFAKACRDLDLRLRWALDAFIVTCVKDQSDEQLALIGQMCDWLNISKGDLLYKALQKLKTNDLNRRSIKIAGATFEGDINLSFTNNPNVVLDIAALWVAAVRQYVLLVVGILL